MLAFKEIHKHWEIACNIMLIPIAPSNLAQLSFSYFESNSTRLDDKNFKLKKTFVGLELTMYGHQSAISTTTPNSQL